MGLADLPLDRRPRERLLRYGPERLTDVELLSVLLGRGVQGVDVLTLSESILHHTGGVGGLTNLAAQELSRLRGLGTSRAAQLSAACELGRRAMTANETPLGTVLSAADVHRYFAPRFAGLHQEAFWVLSLSTRNAVEREHQAALGALNSVTVHPREVFRPALQAGAASAILVHNHPSGDPTPSQDDIAMTERLLRVGALVGIPILDHVIVGGARYSSLAELGLLAS